MEVVKEIEDFVSFKISKLMLSGPESDLKKTENAQLAMFTASMACLRVMEVDYGVSVRDACFLAGHSVGEYSALCASSVLSLGDAAKIVKFRGEAMSRACFGKNGMMYAIIGLRIHEFVDTLRDIEKRFGCCVIANDNSTEQFVISGVGTAVHKAISAAQEKGARVVRLSVGGAFHSPLMSPAAIALDKFVHEFKFSEPKIPVVLNYTALPAKSPEKIVSALPMQVIGRVRWRETLEYIMSEGVDTIIELGPGNVLTNIAKRMLGDKISALEVGTVAKMEDLRKHLKAKVAI
jgi:[acyl-carrier-protein] S-malonyltransferase